MSWQFTWKFWKWHLPWYKRYREKYFGCNLQSNFAGGFGFQCFWYSTYKD